MIDRSEFSAILYEDAKKVLKTMFGQAKIWIEPVKLVFKKSRILNPLDQMVLRYAKKRRGGAGLNHPPP